MITIIGATGTIGRRIVAQLAATGHGCRVVARDAAKARGILGQGPEIATGDYARPETLEAALEGTQRLFLLAPDMPGAEKLGLEANAINAAKRAGVEHLVYLSAPSRGAVPEFAFARLHHETERKIEESGLDWTHLRPIAFMSNLLLSLESIKSDNAFYLPTGDGKVSGIDPADIAAVAVEALTGDGHRGRAYTLTGPEALSHAEQAEQLSAVIGRQIKYVDISEAAAREAMQKAGIPPTLVEDLLEYYALVKADERALISPDFEQVMGRKPRTFATFLEQNAAAFH